MKDTMILGGGIAGIAAGYYLGRQRAEIFEKNSCYGGLCGSFNVEGFTFDTAVHLSFTKDERVRNLFNHTPYFTHSPEAYNYYYGSWLKHPVQNNLYHLPVDEKVKCIVDFVKKPEQTAYSTNYEDWLYNQYGKQIAESFPIRYTRKYWCTEARELSIQWIHNRMYRPSLEEVLKGAMTDLTLNTYYTGEMRYPQMGGYQRFLDPMLSEADIRLGKKAALIDIKKKWVEFEDGTKEYYENLISSVPMNEMAHIIKDVPQYVKDAAEKLLATSVALVSVGFNRPDIPKFLWFYIYDEEVLPARAYAPNLKSPHNVPEGFSSLQFEIYFTKYKPLKESKETLMNKLLNDMCRMGICSKKDVLFMNYREIPFANVVFYRDMLKNRHIVREYLDQNGIISIGRFGEWDYYWSDQSLLSGFEGAKKVINNIG
ncbi:MAG: NAD(P)-binding protein [Clostridia bacterium]|nr:NAD(P)-binding protein [Clostridia bacterium]